MREDKSRLADPTEFVRRKTKQKLKAPECEAEVKAGDTAKFTRADT